jgi:hypothetical protein
MRPRGNRAHGTTPLPQFLDKRVADAKERRQGALGTAVFVIGPEDFLAQIEGVGFHSGQVTPDSPFIQLQTALSPDPELVVMTAPDQSYTSLIMESVKHVTH